MSLSRFRSNSYDSYQPQGSTRISPSCLVGMEDGERTEDRRRDCRPRIASIRLMSVCNIFSFISIRRIASDGSGLFVCSTRQFWEECTLVSSTM